MFVEALLHAVTLDLGWFIDIVMNNLFWAFFFAIAGYFFYRSAIKGQEWFKKHSLLVPLILIYGLFTIINLFVV